MRNSLFFISKVILLICLLSITAIADLQNVGHTPEYPTTDDIVSVYVNGASTSTCHVLDGSDFNINGNTFNFEVFSHFSGGACLFLYAEWSFLETWGTLPAGEYTVTAYESAPLIGEFFKTETFRVVDCSVCITGDLNGSGSISIGDLTLLVEFLFGSGAAIRCPGRFDIDGSNSDPEPTVSDLTYLVDYLFGGGTAPVSCE